MTSRPFYDNTGIITKDFNPEAEFKRRFIVRAKRQRIGKNSTTAVGGSRRTIDNLNLKISSPIIRSLLTQDAFVDEIFTPTVNRDLANLTTAKMEPRDLIPEQFRCELFRVISDADSEYTTFAENTIFSDNSGMSDYARREMVIAKLQHTLGNLISREYMRLVMHKTDITRMRSMEMSKIHSPIGTTKLITQSFWANVRNQMGTSFSNWQAETPTAQIANDTLPINL